jgi:hypothetical protein
MRDWTRRRKEVGGPDAPAAGPIVGG